MNLPNLNPLNNDQSTYITFSKALLDFDKAVMNKSPYVFSNVVALNLPVWNNPDFYISLASMGVTTDNPNTVMPKLFQFYLENLIRQETECPQIVELAFWKALNKCGLDYNSIRDLVVFSNKIVGTNFIQTESNNGWGEILVQIPNKCNLLINSWKEVNVEEVIQSEDDDNCMYDNGNKQFTFSDTEKLCIDFDQIRYDLQTQTSFDFNTLLLFYRDVDGVDKLHGINFIYPFENKITYYELPTLSQRTNDARTLGYQFIFNIKTCNNEASLIEVYDEHEHSFYNQFGELMSGLKSYLETSYDRNRLTK